MAWYKFWKDLAGPGGHDETYRMVSDREPKEAIREMVDEWAEADPGGSYYGYKVGYEPIDAPPIEWLRRELKWDRNSLVGRYEYVQFLINELRRLNGPDETKSEPRRRQDEIPVLPKKEVPENGYRAIYDWVLTNVHPDVLAGETKTTSQVVIELLEKVVR